MRSRLRRIVAPLTVAVAVAAAAIGAAVGAVPAAAASSQAVVIVDTGDATFTRVITFSGTISGYEALVLAGADPVTYGYAGQGAAICRLFGVGNDPGGNSCLGTPDEPRYWAYHRAPAGSEGWQYSRAGAGATRVGDGDVEGWRFGIGLAPGFRAFCAVAGCAPPAPAPAPDPAPGGASAAGASGVSGAAGSAGAAGPDGAAGAPGRAGDAVPGDPAARGEPSGPAGPSAADPAGAGIPAPGGRTRAAVATPEVAAPPGGAGVGADDPGSPAGVLVAGGLALALVALAWTWRRRAA